MPDIAISLADVWALAWGMEVGRARFFDNVELSSIPDLKARAEARCTIHLSGLKEIDLRASVTHCRGIIRDELNKAGVAT